MAKSLMRAPFSYFGGKASVAPVVWDYLGNVQTYIEPFCGGASVLLGRPTRPSTEVINDANGLIANFWRAVKYDPNAVAHFANWPVSEIDLLAREKEVMELLPGLVEALNANPDWFNAQIAGWWVWGQSAAIIGNWCTRIGRTSTTNRPQLGNAYSRGVGVHSNDSAFTDEEREAFLRKWMGLLSNRLRSVLVCCGDWQRVCNSKSVLLNKTPTGVFLDPPYDTKTGRRAGLYLLEKFSALDILDWCKKWGGNKDLRIVVCGLEGEYESLRKNGWTCRKWSASGNFKMADKEELWINPSCQTMPLFDVVGR